MADERITEAEYLQCLEIVTGLCRSINLLPLAAMQGYNEQLQAVAPILDPTGYHRGGGQNLLDQRRIIDAARGLQVACEEVGLRG